MPRALELMETEPIARPVKNDVKHVSRKGSKTAKIESELKRVEDLDDANSESIL